MRIESISRKVRQRRYYTVPAAGAKVGLKRSQSYRAAELGQMPTERHGKFLLVPRRPWDRKVKWLLRGLAPRDAAKAHRDRRKASSTAETTTATT